MFEQKFNNVISFPFDFLKPNNSQIWSPVTPKIPAIFFSSHYSEENYSQAITLQSWVIENVCSLDEESISNILNYPKHRNTSALIRSPQQCTAHCEAIQL